MISRRLIRLSMVSFLFLVFNSIKYFSKIMLLLVYQKTLLFAVIGIEGIASSFLLPSSKYVDVKYYKNKVNICITITALRSLSL